MHEHKHWDCVARSYYMYLDAYVKQLGRLALLGNKASFIMCPPSYL